MRKILFALAIVSAVVGGFVWLGLKVYKPYNRDTSQELGIPADWVAYDESTDSYCLQAGSSKLPAELVVPKDWDDGVHGSHPITIIKSEAFTQNNTLVSLDLSNCTGLVEIEDVAFKSCSKLTNVLLPSNLTYIGIHAFRSCISLTTMDLSRCTGLTNIEYGMFENCGELTEVVLPNSVTSIGDSAFSRCGKLTNIAFTSSLTSIGDSAFRNSGLTSITLPSSLTSIGESAFDGCSGLTSVVFGNPKGWTAGTTELSDEDLANPATAATYLKSTYVNNSWLWSEIKPEQLPTDWLTLEDDHYVVTKGTSELPSELIIPAYYNGLPVTKIADGDLEAGLQGDYSSGVFYGQTGILTITLPDTMEYIGMGAFIGCTGLVQINLPDSIHTINPGAFAMCISLQSIKLPKNLTEISALTFYDCVSLASVDASNTNITSISGEFMGEEVGGPFMMSGDYGEGSLTTIDLSNCDKLTNIGYCAFYGCTKLTNISLPDSICTLGALAFMQCGLTSIDLNGCIGLTRLNGAFMLSGLTSIDLSGCIGLTTIGSMEFSLCPNLTSINLSGCTGLMTIGNEAFAGTNLNSIDLSECTSLTSIGNQVFQACMNLSSITLPSSLTSIGGMAFWYCYRLTSITLPSSLIEIEDCAFDDSYALAEIYNLSGLNIILGSTEHGGVGKYARVIHTSASEPSKIQAIGNVKYYVDKTNFIALTPTSRNITSVTLDSRTTAINQYAFAYCTGLTSIDLSGCTSLTSIGSKAFYNCSGLTSIVIPEGVTSIGNYAFDRCSGLTSIVIPANVTKIGNYAFNGCTNLTSITFEDTSTWYYTSNSDYTGGTAFTVVAGTNYATEFKDTYDNYYWYKTDEPEVVGNLPSDWLTLEGDHYVVTKGTSELPSELIIPAYYNGLPVTKIADGDLDAGLQGDYSSSVFYGQTGIISITLPDTMEHIGYAAFYYCRKLTAIYLSGCINLISIGDNAFYDCSGLTSIDLSECINLTSIGERAFYLCGGLTSIDLSGCTSLTSIGSYAFNWCRGLTSINLSECTSLTSIDDEVFYYCTELTTIDLSSCINLTSIGDWAFSGCTKLTTIDLSGCINLTSIGNSAFYLCGGLTSIVIPANLTSIGSSAFYGCFALAEVYNLSGLTITAGTGNHGDVGYYALVIHTDISIESSIQIINDMYYYVNGTDFIAVGPTSRYITSVILDSRTTAIKNHAFSYCRGLTSINLSGCTSLTSIGDNAFCGCSGLTSITLPSCLTSIGWHAFSLCDSLTSLTFETGGTWYYTSSYDYTGGTAFTVDAGTNYATAFKDTYDNYYLYKA